MPKRHEEVLADVTPGSKAPRPPFQVVGTGFLVRPALVLTNRHVIEAIAADFKASGSYDHWYLQFSYPRLEGGFAETTKRVANVFAFLPAGSVAIDAGLLEFRRGDTGDFEVCQSVEFGDLSTIAVGVDVGVCGFPLGNALLVDTPGVWRFGPVVHHGIISGIAPFDVSDPRRLTAFLTDTNTAGGMSGSPVFDPRDGRVIGLHFAGSQGTLGCALPIDRIRVDGWVRFYERIFVERSNPGPLLMNAAGDILG
jgi:S1-C subfamily serine protease